jgi:type IV pilus assembly protein PilY1
MSSRKLSRHTGALVFAVAIVTWLAGISPALADPTDLSAVPVVANSSVAPNLVMTFDDSGSTSWRYMGDQRPFDRLPWGPSPCANVGGNDVGQNSPTCAPDGPWFCAGVIDPRAPATDVVKSQAMNGVYYNPNVVYSPPKKKDGTSFPNADATLKKVWLDGIAVNKPTGAVAAAATATIYKDVNSLTGANDNKLADLSVTSGTNRWFCGYGPSSASPFAAGGPYYYRLLSTVTLTTDVNGNPDAASITKIYTATNWEAVSVPATDYQNFANWYAYYRTRNMMARTSMTRAFDKVGDKVRIAWQNLNTNTSLTTIYPLIDSLDAAAPAAAKTWRTSYFNWLFGVNANGGTPNTNALERAGTFLSGGSPSVHDATNPYWEPIKNLAAGGMELSCRQNFHLLMTDGYWNSNSVAVKTPTPRSAAFNLPTDDNVPPLPTMNYSPSAPDTRVYWNQKAGSDTPSLADLAFYYWAKDLRPDLANHVAPYVTDTTIGVTNATVRPIPAVPLSDSEIYFNPANDPATWQHIVQYTIGEGAPGVNTPTDAARRAATLLTFRKGTAQWEAALNNVANAIDDTWHAAVNSRGKYFNAGNPQQLVDALSEILTGIALRRGSNSAISINSSLLTTNSKAYVTAYDSSDWSGSVMEKALALDGSLGTTVLWDAGCIVTGGPCTSTGSTANPPAPTRKILSSKTPTGSGIAFQFASLSSAQQGWLNTNPTSGLPDGNGDLRLKYVRGDRTQEQAGATPLFRTRSSVFGAVINSSAIYHTRPSDGYGDHFPSGSVEAIAAAAHQSYEQFVFDNKDSAATIYVGANDGMLHALDATTGNELWAYVPYAVSQNLNKLTATPYKFQPFVDNTPVIHDVFTNGAWRTLLVGTLRMGGRGVYALDVTKPASIDESAAGTAAVKWEFSNYIGSAAANMGYTFGQPNVARLPGVNGKWVVLVPAGYFQDPLTDATDPTAGLPARLLKQSSLFVLDASDGSLITEMKTPSGIVSYGLSSPSIGSYTPDDMADFAVAGDLVGNLWRFDLTDLSTVDQLFAPATNGAQPITVMPQLFPDTTTQGVIVVYGTGKYLGVKDRDDAATMPVQAYYGIREYGKGQPAATLSDLVQQQITDDAAGIRSVTSNDVPATTKGWYFNLDQVAGERNVLNAGRLINTGRAVLESLIPAGADPCDPSINGALMIVDASTGSPPVGRSPFGSGSVVTPDTIDHRVGKRVRNPPTTGEAPVASQTGGGQLIIPAEPTPIAIPDSYWRRRSWQPMGDGL